MTPALRAPLRTRAQYHVQRRATLAKLDRQYAEVTRADLDLSVNTRAMRQHIRAKGGMSPVERETGVRLD